MGQLSRISLTSPASGAVEISVSKEGRSSRAVTGVQHPGAPGAGWGAPRRTCPPLAASAQYGDHEVHSRQSHASLRKTNARRTCYIGTPAPAHHRDSHVSTSSLLVRFPPVFHPAPTFYHIVTITDYQPFFDFFRNY